MKHFKKAKKLASKVNAKVAVGALLIASASPAYAEGTDDLWAAIDLTGITVKVIAAGVIVLGMTMAFKSVRLGKRTINLA